MTVTPTTQPRALRSGTVKHLEPITIDPGRTVEALQESIGSDNFDVVGLEDDSDVFVDDEGPINESPLNLRVTVIAHRLGRPVVLFGNAVALGCDMEMAESISLTDAQVYRLTAALAARPSPDIIDQLAAYSGRNETMERSLRPRVSSRAIFETSTAGESVWPRCPRS
ncbi:DUF3846 domain-containing protein [Cryobacterium sp. Y57]|uniref:DUF3846 domain-containing protein n=1 Tax=Cryobacterium sp. Y57 TaxID=2048287 RepID=UPI001304A358|nr:DUF3846 domain-containing protein [Cryobacterium sp. Y57]